jgi:hypothetical protein
MPLARAAVRVLAFTIAMAFGASLWAACADAATVGAGAQMACCKDGELSCPSHGSPTDCCETDAARPRDAVAGLRIDPVHTLTAVVAWAALPETIAGGVAHVRFHQIDSPPHIDPGPPPYIAFSSLLI